MSTPPADEDLDTRERMMFATLHVLHEHGYAGLSIQRIADEADLSKSSIYHFFDDKDDLLISFLDFMLASYGMPFADATGDDPIADLWHHFDFALYGITDEMHFHSEDFDPGSGQPYVELRAQSAHDDAYRERFTDIDGTIHDRIVGILESGIDDGVFRDVDADQVADLLLTLMLGGLFRRATADGVDPDTVRAELETYLDARLYADGVDASDIHEH